MTKEFVKYEQALALKELGFDEPCFFPYNKEGEICWNEKVFHNIQYQRYDFPIFDEKSIHYIGIRAPLYQQAFRWFREKHRLYVSINIHADNMWSVVVKSMTSNSTHTSGYVVDLINKGYSTFKIYEEAESACLDKLIEIIKNK